MADRATRKNLPEKLFLQHVVSLKMGLINQREDVRDIGEISLSR